jgi:iron complex transport system permease protein
MSRLRASRLGAQDALDAVATAKIGEGTDEVARAVPSPIRTRLLKTVGGFGLLLIVTCVIAPLVGSSPISLARVFDRSIPFSENVDAQIFFVARMPRVLAGAVVGAALASAGVVFQALLRNALATPFTLGVSAGASLGAMLAIVFGATISAGALSAVPLASLAGAGLAAAIVYRLATMQDRAMSTTVLLLAGVTLNSFFSALIMFVQYIADFAQVYRAVRWIMGDLDVGSFDPIVASLPMLAISFAMFAWLPSSLNLLSMGADAASARGVDVGRAQRLAFVSASLATAAAVSLAGPIGFIGIVVPHLVRLIVGVDHRLVLPASALFGAAFLVACDLAARTLMAPLEIPVGVITAMLGGPFFLWLLVRKG